MNAFITTISMLAALVNVSCNVPHLVTMFRTRSSSGQSILGWVLALAANTALAFVNWFGNHSPVLAIGNILSASACLTAICQVRLYRHTPDEEPAAVDGVTNMRTPELAVPRDAVRAEHQRRTGERELLTA
jgi:hypothetical protein